ncbi:MAG: DUF1415 domain-containing protein [Chitinophagaceae bacterium]|nr:DUF1415 domain-containing protein [Chitinophagaceae bacterium]
MIESHLAIEQTKKWIHDVVIGCNFCPFAAKPFNQKTIFYRVEESAVLQTGLQSLMEEVYRLDTDAETETTFLVFTNACTDFDDYLDLVSQAEYLLKLEGYNGIYQLASFHPLYRFAGSDEDDAANFTNRSVYPMLHLLRESSIDKALEYYKNPEDIPGRNIHFAREKGIVYMKMLRDACSIL